MRTPEAMGPEAALLSARLAEFRAMREYHGLEMPAETSLYVEACVRRPLGEFPRDGGRFAALRRLAARVWARGAAWRRPVRAMPLLEAAPLAVEGPEGLATVAASLAEAFAAEVPR